jgi:hypothetical protein
VLLVSVAAGFLMHPSSLIVLGGLMAGWVYVFAVRTTPLVLNGRELRRARAAAPAFGVGVGVGVLVGVGVGGRRACERARTSQARRMQPPPPPQLLPLLLLLMLMLMPLLLLQAPPPPLPLSLPPTLACMLPTPVSRRPERATLPPSPTPSPPPPLPPPLHPPSDREKATYMSVASFVVIFFLTNVASVVFSALMMGAALVAAHGATRVPDDLFVDDDAGQSLLSIFTGGPKQPAGIGNV